MSELENIKICVKVAKDCFTAAGYSTKSLNKAWKIHSNTQSIIGWLCFHVTQYIQKGIYCWICRLETLWLYHQLSHCSINNVITVSYWIKKNICFTFSKLFFFCFPLTRLSKKNLSLFSFFLQTSFIFISTENSHKNTKKKI